MTAELPLEQSEKYTAELLLLGFNFGRDVPRGVTINATPTFSVADYNGSNPADITVTLASPAYSGTRAQAYYAGGTPGSTYKLICKATFSDGQAPLEIHGLLYIKQV